MNDSEKAALLGFASVKAYRKTRNRWRHDDRRFNVAVRRVRRLTVDQDCHQEQIALLPQVIVVTTHHHEQEIISRPLAAACYHHGRMSLHAA